VTEEKPLPPIVRAWIAQLTSPEVLALVREFGDSRRIDLTLFSDRGRVPRPPVATIK
jgi:hypothetical protein